MRSFVSRLATVFAVACLLIGTSAVARDADTVWIPTWYAAPVPSAAPDANMNNQTLRQMVRISAGGSKVRLRLSNAYGAQPLRLDEVRIARRSPVNPEAPSRIDITSDRVVTFGGRQGVTIAPGAYVVSDPAEITVTAHADLAISVHVAGPTPLATVHDIQRGGFYVAPGNVTAAQDLPQAPVDLGIGRAFPWIAQVEVAGSTATAAIIAFGDSITDGFGMAPDSGTTWPDIFSRRVSAAGLPLSVINAGISGNRILHNGQWGRFGDGALARFDRDVLAQPNAAAVIVLIGINDLGHAQGPGSPGYVSSEDLIFGLSQMATRAHARGMRIYAATMTPFRGTAFNGYFSEEKETRRQAINAWMRSTDTFDGVFDFDAALADPERPGYLKPDYDLGDHLHPDADGMAAMAKAIPLSAFDWAKGPSNP